MNLWGLSGVRMRNRPKTIPVQAQTRFWQIAGCSTRLFLASVILLFGFFQVGSAVDVLPSTPDQAEPVDQPEDPRSRPALDLTALDRPIDADSYLVGPGDELAVNIFPVLAAHQGTGGSQDAQN